MHLTLFRTFSQPVVSFCTSYLSASAVTWLVERVHYKVQNDVVAHLFPQRAGASAASAETAGNSTVLFAKMEFNSIRGFGVSMVCLLGFRWLNMASLDLGPPPTWLTCAWNGHLTKIVVELVGSDTDRGYFYRRL